MTKAEYLKSIGYENLDPGDDYYENVYQKEILSKFTGEEIVIEIDLNEPLFPSTELHFVVRSSDADYIVYQEQIDELQEVYNIAKRDFEEMMKYED